MKFFLVLLFFVKFTFAYRLYSRDGFNLSESDYHHNGIYEECDFNRDIKPSEINDADVMKCILDWWFNDYKYKILYCEPPKIIDENNECVDEIDFEQWQNVLNSSLKSNDDFYDDDDISNYDYDYILIFVYLEHGDSKKNKKKLGRRIYSRYEQKIAAIGKTSENKYELFGMETCLEKIFELSHSKGYAKLEDEIDSMEFLLSFTPQLMSIICYLILLTFYLTIGELKRTIYGKCWINFIINSLINYLGTIVVLVSFKTFWKEIFKRYQEILGEITEILLGLLTNTVAFTEFSLYFWLNITFFEAFYTIR
jgi:hypothetical protein